MPCAVKSAGEDCAKYVLPQYFRCVRIVNVLRPLLRVRRGLIESGISLIGFRCGLIDHFTLPVRM